MGACVCLDAQVAGVAAGADPGEHSGRFQVDHVETQALRIHLQLQRQRGQPQVALPVEHRGTGMVAL